MTVVIVQAPTVRHARSRWFAITPGSDGGTDMTLEPCHGRHAVKESRTVSLVWDGVKHAHEHVHIHSCIERGR